MRSSAGRRLLLGLGWLLAAAWFVTGIQWGLPSRAADPYLFGDEPVWDGAKILALSGGWGDDTDVGADVDVDPLTGREKILSLNETDEQRAEILLRYRLYSYQPDEMITFRALSRMRPAERRLDPGLYQYGGLWIYPVGALLKLASLPPLRYVHITADVAHYLDHPEDFGRFYVVARLYTVLWALIGVWAVYQIARRLGGPARGWLVPAAAAACYACLPVVVNMAHEAKPHLPGAVLMLLACLAAAKYVDTGLSRWWIAAGAFCGAALGMVLTGLPVFAVLPVMVLLRSDPWPRRLARLAGSVAVAGSVYAVTNPYLLINVLRGRDVLGSNLGNTGTFYKVAVGWDGLANSARLVGEGTSYPLAIVGALAIAVLVCFRSRANSSAARPDRGLFWLLLAPAALVVVQMTLLGAGKPGEYGRFGVFPDVVLAVLAVTAAAAFVARPRWRTVTIAALFVAAAVSGARYLANFVLDSGPETTRLTEARRLEEWSDKGSRSIALRVEPAPYAMPPVNVFHWDMKLLPRDYAVGPADVPADVIVEPVDALPGVTADRSPAYVDLPSVTPGAGWPTPISWAAKPMRVRVRSGLATSATEAGTGGP